MKKGLYSRCLLARMLAPGPVRRLRSFGASRAKSETNVGFNPLQRVMKRGYIARRPVRKLRSFGASRAKPETNIGFNPLHPVRYEPPHASAASQKFL